MPPKPATFKLAGSLSTATANDKPKFQFTAPPAAGAAEHAAEVAAPAKFGAATEDKSKGEAAGAPKFAAASGGTFGGVQIGKTQ